MSAHVEARRALESMLREYIDVMEAVTRRRPFETAPRGGVRILLLTPEDDETDTANMLVVIGYRSENDDWNDGAGTCWPTHWMPLPEVPK